MKKRHRLLRRQLKKLDLSPDQVQDIEPLLQQIEAAYIDFDNDISHLETIIEKSSQELFDTNKKLQNNVISIRDQLNRVVSNIHEVIFETDINGNWTYLNPAWKTFTGLSVEDSLGKHFSEFFLGESNLSILGEISIKNIGDKTFTRVIEYTNHNGEKKWAEVSLGVVSDSNGWHEGTIGSIVDITRLKQIESDLISARDKESKANKAKVEFLSTMSHEIRTPLNAVIGISHLLLLENPKAEQLKSLNALKFSSEHLLGLINDILDFNKIESGALELEFNDFSLSQILEGLKSIFHPKSIDKGITFSLTKGDTVPNVIVGDSIRLSQVLTNLVSNAVKFTEEGEVKLNIKTTAQDEKSITIFFEIIDTGIGIPENKQGKIFESFTQANSDTTRKYGGTGLGLAICQKLLSLMDSKLDLKSIEGQGSTFSFELKFSKSKNPSNAKTNYINPSPTFSSLSGLTILVVEDFKMNIMVIERFLQRWEVDYKIATNGAIAVDMAKEGDYDLILMDLQMPVMNGYDSSKEIRQGTTDHNKTIPIFVLSASASVDVKTKITEFGMNGHISKPFNPTDLYNLLKSYHR